jgi:methyl-accepting chemotaxis protein
MEDATREIRELMLRISREIQEAEVVEARLDAGEVDEQTYVEQMRALLDRIQSATRRIGEQLDDLQERGRRA